MFRLHQSDGPEEKPPDSEAGGEAVDADQYFGNFLH